MSLGICEEIELQKILVDLHQDYGAYETIMW